MKGQIHRTEGRVLDGNLDPWEYRVLKGERQFAKRVRRRARRRLDRMLAASRGA